MRIISIIRKFILPFQIWVVYYIMDFFTNNNWNRL